MFNAIIKPLLLKENITWDDFSYPPVLAWAMLLLLGVLTGLDPNMSEGLPLPLWFAIAFGMVLTFAAFAVIVPFIRWWMGRKGCDGQGRMFRLVMATAAIDVVSALLTLLGVSYLLTLPLWLYSVWVAGHALAEVCKASLGYSVTGVILSVVVAVVAVTVLSVALVTVATVAGLLPPMGMPVQ